MARLALRPERARLAKDAQGCLTQPGSVPCAIQSTAADRLGGIATTMDKHLDFSDLNEGKVNFDHIYTSPDPREYFKQLGQLDYIIPHLAQPMFVQLIRARQELTGRRSVTVLDLGCSYGVNGALLKYGLFYDALRNRYTAPALQELDADEMLRLDQAFYRAWPRRDGVRLIGLDVSGKAVSYGAACGTLDVGLEADLENRDPTAEEAEHLAEVDLIISTGCVGYVTSKTFARIMALQRGHHKPWIASFVLRMFGYDQIADTLAQNGLETEKFDGATFVQRRFATRNEMEATVQAVEGRDLDTRGHEAEGLFHADLFLSRPRTEVARQPLNQLISVVSGANKPWTIGTRVLSGFGPSARRRAQAQRTRSAISLAAAANDEEGSVRAKRRRP